MTAIARANNQTGLLLNALSSATGVGGSITFAANWTGPTSSGNAVKILLDVPTAGAPNPLFEIVYATVVNGSPTATIVTRNAEPGGSLQTHGVGAIWANGGTALDFATLFPSADAALVNSTANYTIPTQPFTMLTLNANCTLTFPLPGGAYQFTLLLAQDGTGDRTVTWPGSITWPGGTLPTLSVGTLAHDYFQFVTTDGTSWDAIAGGAGVNVTASKTANYTAKPGDFVPCDTTAAWTLLLPSEPIPGTSVWAKKTTSDANYLTVAAQDGATIDGSATMTISAQYQTAQFVFAGEAIGWHRLPRMDESLWTPSDAGLVAAPFDPALCGGALTMVAGTVYGCRVRARASSAANILFGVQTAAATFTSGKTYGAVYSGDGGTLIGYTADLSATLITSTGAKTAAIVFNNAGGAISTIPLVPGQFYWVVFYCATFSTLPKLAAGSSGTGTPGFANMGYGAASATSRFALTLAAQTSTPANTASGGLTTGNLWAFISSVWLGLS